MTEPPGRLRTAIHAYAIGSGVFLLIVGLLMAKYISDAKAEAKARHAKRIAVAEAPELPAGATPVEVKAGIYVDRIEKIDFGEAAWTVDFYVWFNWDGDTVAPGKRFQVVDGKIEQRELLREVTSGSHHYELYRVTATFTKVFTVTRFPMDDHGLIISIEDAEQGMDRLVFVPDTEGSEVSSRVKINGYVVTGTAMISKPHAYKTTRGDPTLEAGHVSVYSQLVYGISVGRPDAALFLKLFLALYVAIGVSMLVFFIKPTDVDARFGLSVGALFAVMANAYVISSSVPEASGMSMADLLTGLAILTILLTLVQSTIALTLCHRNQEELADRFDRITVISLTAAFVIGNLLIPLAA